MESRAWRKLDRELAAWGASGPPDAPELVSEAELAALPPAARALMDFYGVTPGTPKHWSVQLGWVGRFRLGPDKPWMDIQAVQADLRAPILRVFHMYARMGRVVPILARDVYAGGHGHMVAKIGHLVPVADGSGPEYDQGELVTWLNDTLLFAPSMLLGPGTFWSHVDDRTFDIELHDRGNTVHARVFLDERGAPVDFETTDRFLSDPDNPRHPLVRGRWSTPTTSWVRVGAASYPSRGKAVWHLPSRDFEYADFALAAGSPAFDVARA